METMFDQRSDVESLFDSIDRIELHLKRIRQRKGMVLLTESDLLAIQEAVRSLRESHVPDANLPVKHGESDVA